MDLFEFALEKEQYAENYYRDLAQKTDDVGLRTILVMMAEDEVKHYETITQMRDKTVAEHEHYESPVIKNAKEIFQKMKDGKQKFDLNVSHVELYRKAQEFEKKSQVFYAEKADEVSDDLQRDFLLKLSKEEEKHYVLLENIIQLLQRPKTWLANAEFNNLEAY